LMTNT